MKYLLVGLVLALGVIAAPAHAEEIFGFMDGQYFDSNYVLKYLCFLDNHCYDTNGVEVTIPGRTAPTSFAPNPISNPINIPVTPVSNPVSNPTNQVTNPVSSLNPAYTEAELLQKIGTCSKPFNLNVQCFLPGIASPSSNSVYFGLTGDSKKWVGVSIIFQGQTVLTEQGAYHPEYKGYRTWNEIFGLQPDTTYTYQYVYKESGRQDTVLDKTFKTTN